jgi:hypothetical protein
MKLRDSEGIEVVGATFVGNSANYTRSHETEGTATAMGLFSKTSPLDPDIEAKTLGFDEKYRHSSLRYVAKHQDGIRARLGASEEIQVVAVHAAGLRSHLVVITSERVMELIGSSILKQSPRGKIAGASSMEIDSVSFVAIETETARMDYRPGDPRRADHMMFAPAATPRHEQTISAAIGG